MKKANILALDTSTEACTVALQVNGKVAEKFAIIPRHHNQELLPMIQQVLADQGVTYADLDCIAFGRGPGSFTGLRITVGVVQGLAFGADIPVIPVSTLACMAQGYHRQTGDSQCLVAMQARQEEIYFGVYELADGCMRSLAPDVLINASDARLVKPGEWHGVGNGWQHKSLLEAGLGIEVPVIDLEILPHASDLITLAEPELLQGRTLVAAEAMPVYLRETVARKST